MLNFYKEIIANVENASFLQSLAGVLFFIFFVIMVIKAYSKPKNYYRDMSDLPLEDENNTNNKN
jgi:cbb3-type cytochrome oxidase subunit 3